MDYSARKEEELILNELGRVNQKITLCRYSPTVLKKKLKNHIGNPPTEVIEQF